MGRVLRKEVKIEGNETEEEKICSWTRDTKEGGNSEQGTEEKKMG